MYFGRHPWDADADDDVPECDHMDYETDILTGFATCACGHRWMQTREEIERERQRQIEYDKMCRDYPVGKPRGSFMLSPDESRRAA